MQLCGYGRILAIRAGEVMAMQYEIVPPRRVSDSWLVEAINYGPPIGDGDGEIASALFYGLDAEARARAYAALMNGLAAKG